MSASTHQMKHSNTLGSSSSQSLAGGLTPSGGVSSPQSSSSTSCMQASRLSFGACTWEGVEVVVVAVGAGLDAIGRVDVAPVVAVDVFHARVRIVVRRGAGEGVGVVVVAVFAVVGGDPAVGGIVGGLAVGRVAEAVAVGVLAPHVVLGAVAAALVVAASAAAHGRVAGGVVGVVARGVHDLLAGRREAGVLGARGRDGALVRGVLQQPVVDALVGAARHPEHAEHERGDPRGRELGLVLRRRGFDGLKRRQRRACQGGRPKAYRAIRRASRNAGRVGGGVVASHQNLCGGALERTAKTDDA